MALRYFPALAEAPPLQGGSQSEVYLKVLGPVRVERKDGPIPYRGRRRLELLCYLLETRIAGKAQASLVELLDTFYPEAEESRGKATLKQQIHLIRMTLGSEAIHSTPEGYALGAVWSDAEEFLQSGSVRLWRGPYLEHLSDGWHGGVREALTLSLRAKAEALLEAEPKEALRLAQILVAMEPYDSDYLRLSLRAAQGAGGSKAVARLYTEALERFREVGETLPGIEALLRRAPSPT